MVGDIDNFHAPAIGLHRHAELIDRSRHALREGHLHRDGHGEPIPETAHRKPRLGQD